MEDLGRNPDVIERAKRLRSDLGDPVKVILGVDRLDYTKGIEHRLKAYRELLTDGRVKVQDTVMVQVAAPSRERVEHYKILRDKVGDRPDGRVAPWRCTTSTSRSTAPRSPRCTRGRRRGGHAAAGRDEPVAKEYVAAWWTRAGRCCSAKPPVQLGAAESYLINPHDVAQRTRWSALRRLRENRARMRDAAPRARQRRPGLGPFVPARARTTGPLTAGTLWPGRPVARTLG